MRLLFVTAAFAGHYNPLVPLGWAALADGHEVMVASHPGFASTITGSGLPALPVGPDIEPFAFMAGRREDGQDGQGGPDRQARDGARSRAGFRQIAERFAALMADEAVDFTRYWRPDAVVYEPMALLGPLLARIVGVPAVRHLWTMDFTAHASDFSSEADSPLAAAYNVGRVPVHGDLTIDPCPPRLQIADDLPRQLIRYVPYNGRAVVPDWLGTPPARPRVCVTWGATLGHLGRMGHVPGVVRALGELPCDVVIAVTDEQRELFTDLPANVTHIGPVALDQLLPSCDAVVHHGGGGTTMTAAVHGIPQLILPSLPDQAFNARQLAAAGAGRHIPPGAGQTPEAVLAETRLILTRPGYRQAAGDLRAELLAQPTPAEVTRVLERLAARYAAAR
jgi:UDP:flavonoid glycosyltransferase YjiC (YdhE family)